MITSHPISHHLSGLQLLNTTNPHKHHQHRRSFGLIPEALNFMDRMVLPRYPSPDDYIGHPYLPLHFELAPFVSPLPSTCNANLRLGGNIDGDVLQLLNLIYTIHDFELCPTTGLFHVLVPGRQPLHVIVVELRNDQISRWRELDQDVQRLVRALRFDGQPQIPMRYYRSPFSRYAPLHAESTTARAEARITFEQALSEKTRKWATNLLASTRAEQRLAEMSFHQRNDNLVDDIEQDRVAYLYNRSLLHRQELSRLTGEHTPGLQTTSPSDLPAPLPAHPPPIRPPPSMIINNINLGDIYRAHGQIQEQRRQALTFLPVTRARSPSDFLVVPHEHTTYAESMSLPSRPSQVPTPGPRTRPYLGMQPSIDPEITLTSDWRPGSS